MLERIKQVFAPPIFDNEEKARVAALLNTMLFIVLALVIAFAVIALITEHSIARFALDSTFALLAVGLLLLLRRGRVQLAGFVLSFALWALVTVGTYLFGGLRASGASSYFGIVVIAGLLLGGKATIIFGALSFLGLTWMFLADKWGIIPPPSAPVTVFTLWMESATILVGVTGLLYLAARSLENALARARRHERELVQKTAEVQQLAHTAVETSEFKSRLIARVSHELRTPLAAILGLTEMLHYAAYGPISEEQRELTLKIIRHAQHLERIISELLEQSQFESGIWHLTSGPCNLNALLSGIEVSFAQLAQAKGLTLKTEMGKEMPQTVYSDCDKVQQILSSLVSNAIKFTKTGSIKVRIDRFDDVYWTIKVSDTGIGIPGEAQTTLFEPFRQLDDSVTREYGGFGLGLALVKELASLMGGTVALESEAGKGSTFTVMLPLYLEKEKGPDGKTAGSGD